MRVYVFSEYQYVFKDGSMTTVNDMTDDQLKVALCEAMDALELVEAASERVGRIIDNWRR